MAHTLSNLLYFFLFIQLTSCNTESKESGIQEKGSNLDNTIEPKKIINNTGSTIKERFNVPNGYIREEVPLSSFAHFLRNTSLKPSGSNVKLYDGKIMPYVSKNVSAGILDISVGRKDLQQCADAIIRLRSEYFYKQKQFDKISFTLTNGFKMNFTDWMMGKRLKVNGNKTWLEKTASPSSSYEALKSYLDHVFMYAGTISMVKETKKVNIEDMQIGDIFVISDAHAVIIVDMCTHSETGEKLFMLAQSYMPARSIHVLQNHNNTKISPWYSTQFGETLKTPQWTFDNNDLRRYND